MPTVRRLQGLFIALATLLAGARAEAQQFGQWWWDGFLGAGIQRYENSLDGARVSLFESRRLGLGLGINGFLGHPALGRFRLGVEYGIEAQRGNQAVDSANLGFSLGLDVLPRGTYSFSLNGRHGSWAYGQGGEGSPPLAATLPDRETSGEARFRIRSGLLDGTTVGVRTRRYTYLDPGVDPDREDGAFIDWNRRIGRAQNTLHVDRTARDHSFGGYSSDVWTGTFDHFGRVNGSWSWQARLVGIRSDYTYESGGGTEDDGFAVGDYRLFANVQRFVRRGDLVDLRLEGGLVRPSGGDGSEAWGASLFYRWNLAPGTQVSPFVQASRVSSTTQTYTLPRAGVEASWSRSAHRLALLAFTRAAYGRLERSEPEGMPGEKQLALSVSASAGYGTAETLRPELEVQASRNDVSLSGTGRVPAGPELPVYPTAGLGIDDLLQVRLRLHHAFGQGRLVLHTHWSTMRRDSPAPGGSFDLDSAFVTVEAAYRGVASNATAGRSELRGSAGAPQETRYAVLTLSARPWRILDLTGSYRMDQRETILAGRADLERIEVGAALRVGLFDLRGIWFRADEQLDPARVRRNEGLRVSLTRQFAGLLPVVTGSKRRGVVR